MQALGAWFLDTQPFTPCEDDYLVYTFNRFQACRFGLEGVYVDPANGAHLSLAEHILRTMDTIAPYAHSDFALLRTSVEQRHNDAHWLRECQAHTPLLGEVSRQAALRFRQVPPMQP